MSRRVPLGESETARAACARGLLRAGVVEKTGEVLSAAVLAQRVGWVAERHPHPVENPTARHHVWHRITKLIRDATRPVS
ncbi:hypothetical protein C4B68_12330 [Streptomyces dengpaensis]|uniref:Uncharacterized protein n=1 Tax=Streptomyces dengpaensis TaxID=2049881 RepID=A0ABN5I2U1_9ACTN|nr:hypothetical protein C4B68_12330 [Streptomyces dengpaensis]PIB10541.1 hypothetical protein B1C81_08765 [Streptomyces sp. HG99]